MGVRSSWFLLLLAVTTCHISQGNPQNMTVISSKGVLLSIQETNCTSKDICSIESNLSHEISSLFSPWSHWSKCKKSLSGSLVQARERSCMYWEICQRTVLKEEKPCHRKKKKRKKKPNKPKINRKDRDNDLLFHVVTMSSVLSIKHLGSSPVQGGSSRSGTENTKRIYSKWSRWTMCSKSCLTQRYRWCKKVDVCGNDVIRQTAYCYTEGSHCEIWLQEKFSQEEPVAIESGKPRNSSRRRGGSPKEMKDLFKGPSRSPVGTTESKAEYQHQHFQPQPNSIELPITETIPPISFFESSSDQEFSCGVSFNASSKSPHQSNMLRIIGGHPTFNGKWPWIVAVLNRFKEAFCGGTLVSARWVLTAAHCVRKRLYVTIGEYDLNRKDDNEIRLRVRKAVIHPKYNVETVDNDLALLYLPSSSFQQSVACLPKPKDHLPFKQMCTIVGWGKRSPSDQYGTDILHEAQVPIVPRSACKEVYTDYQITGNMFCAGYRKGRMDSCSGDSGGPLLCRDQLGRWTVFGITSFGEGCGKRGKYGIYTRLPNYVRWIQRVINNS